MVALRRTRPWGSRIPFWILLPVVLGMTVSGLVAAAPAPGHSESAAPSTGVPPLRSAVSPAILSDPNPYVMGMAATVAIGAPNLDTYWTNHNASAFKGEPEYAKFDAHGDLWVTDISANRLLEFLPPFTTGGKASLVIGQSTLTGDLGGTTAVNLSNPVSQAFDATGNLWVDDYGNNRILEFKPPFSTGMDASLVIGQASFTTSASGTTASTLGAPQDISFDAHGDLWVPDLVNNRVLEFVPPFADGMPASLVLGQTSFTSGTPGTTATTLYAPTSAYVDPRGDLWVSDDGNNRVLEYLPPLSTGATATLALGQSSLTTSSSTGTDSLFLPVQAIPDTAGNIWVSDEGHNRVVEFAPPFSTFQAPSIAVGQSALTGTQSGLTATNLSGPYGVAFGTGGSLWITDGANNRLLEYLPARFGVTLVPTGLPAGTPWSAVLRSAVPFSPVSSATTLSGSGSISGTLINGTYTANVVAPAGYRADPAYFPISVTGSAQTFPITFTSTAPNPFSNGMPATIVIGQPNFETAFAGIGPGFTNASDMSDSTYAATFDAAGDLWVADGFNNRVLEYTPPFTDGMPASLVLGQTSFTGSSSGTSPSNLWFPDGVAFDADGNLWVSEVTNNRVLEFTPPFVSGMAASLVLGQPTFFSRVPSTSAIGLAAPAGLSFDAHGDLWVADETNDRVVEYVPPFSNDLPATIALGQTSMSTSTAATSPTGENQPVWVSFDSVGDAWVADYGNNRVLEYPAPLSMGEAATVVLGQSTLSTLSSTGPDSLSEPNGVSVVEGNVWVADSAHNRVLEFVGPTFSNFQTPSLVLGQGNLTTTASSLGPSGLGYPAAVFSDRSGNIWVGDLGNARVLGYIPPSYSLNYTETGLPSGATWSVTINGTTHGSSASSVVVPEYNGTYGWSAPSVPGYMVTSVASGTATVNGATTTVALTYSAVTYLATFSETNLPPGTSWSVVINGITYSSSAPSLLVPLANGTYSYRVPSVPGFAPAVSTGSVTITSAGASELVVFGPFTYAVTFTEKGLPTGTAWSVTVNGVVFSSATATLVVPEPNGTFSYQVGGVPNYAVSPGSGSGSVLAAPASVSISYTATTSSPLSTGGTLLWALLAAVVVLAILVVVLAMRGRKKGGTPTSPPPAAWSGPGSAGPPPSSAGPAPSPWSESGPPPRGGPPT